MTEDEIDAKGSGLWRVRSHVGFEPLMSCPTLICWHHTGQAKTEVSHEELEANKKRIEDTLRNYGIEFASIKASIGPTVTLYELVPAPGVRISKNQEPRG